MMIEWQECIGCKKRTCIGCNIIEESVLKDTERLTANSIFTDDPWKTQVEGSHYTDMAIQPMEYSMANNMNPLQHTIIKYVSRYENKNGVTDLYKAKDCINMLINLVEGNDKERNK